MAKTHDPHSEHTAAPFRFAPLRPLRFERAAPCRRNCPSGTPVRDWIAAIAQHQDPATADEALAAAWRLLVEYNPFPATMGRMEFKQRCIPITLYTAKRIHRRQLPLSRETFVAGDMDAMDGAMRQLGIEIPLPNDYPRSHLINT